MRNKITFLLGIILSVYTVNGRIIKVPEEFPSIQEGINAAAKGDTIIVDKGTYYENINFRGKNIVVSSKYILTDNIQDILTTTIDGSHSTQIDTGSCVLMMKGEDSTAVIEGFTIRNGTGTSCTMSGGARYREGGGIILYNSNGVIKHNLIINNQSIVISGVNSGGGGGISAMYGRPTIANNVIMNNSSPYAAGIVLNWSGGIIRNNIVYGNYGGSSYGTGGIMVWKSPYLAILENNTVVANISAKDAGGISITTTPTTIIRNNLVWGNRQVTGKQITGFTSSMLFNNNTEETCSGTDMISAFPEFDNFELILKSNSAGVDAGISTAEFNDIENVTDPGNALHPSKGTTRNDIGAYGGECATDLPLELQEKIYIPNGFNYGKISVPASKKIEIEIANFGLIPMALDSIVLGKDLTTFTLNKDLNGKQFKPFERDTIKLTWTPLETDTIKDTIFLYHKCTTISNPYKIAVSGISNKVAAGMNILNKDPGYRVYPNPFSTNFNIISSLEDEILEITLFNASGKELKSMYLGKNGISLFNYSANHLKSGLYILKIRGKKSSSTKRLVKI